jgi:streptogramin lyase
MAAAAEAISISEFRLPDPSSVPGGITSGPDGNLWFSELASNKIGRITTAGTVTAEFNVPGGDVVNELPAGIVTGADGNVWFAEPTSNTIGRITPAGVVTQFDVPTANSAPADIALGPDGNLWFTEATGNQIGRLTPAGVFREFPLPTAGAGPLGITAGPDGNLWFAEGSVQKIGRITPQGTIVEFPLPDAASGPGPAKIVTGPDGNLWFTEVTGDRIGRITPAGAVTTFALPTADAQPLLLTAAADGNLWFTEINANQVGSITTAGAITEYPIPTAGSGFAGITAGPDGNVWFTESKAGQVARINLVTPGVCTPGPTTLCLDDQPGDRRWQVRASYRTTQGGGLAGNGNAIPLASLGVSHGGLFWFFSADNPEMLIKVLNACAVNQRFWVFYSATTNVGFTVNVTDTRLGRQKVYTNRDGVAAPPIQDTSAFSCIGGDELRSGADPEVDAAIAEIAATVEIAANPVDLANATNAANMDLPALGEKAAGCTTTATRLCIGGRFAVDITYHTTQGGGLSGSGKAIGLTGLGVSQGGLFWFFGQDNPEMLIKVVNGCALNNRFWLFYAAGTNVGFTATVTDTQTGHTRTYTNKDGTAAPPVQDTSAFSCS